MRIFQKDTVLAVTLMLISTVYAQFPWGTGTAEDPYHITSPQELNSVRDFLSSYFTLDSDIDLSEFLSEGNPGFNDSAYWVPIGTSDNPFTGTVYGNEQKIKNLKINRPQEYNIGLFGYTENATIKDIKINVDPASKVYGKDQTGSLIGYCFNSTISSCSTVSSIEGDGNLGGLIGYCDSCKVTDSKAVSNVKGYSGVGGLIGATYRSEVSECSSDGIVEGKYEFAGGLIGVCSGKVERSYSTCTVLGGDTYTGGFTGGDWPCDLTDCYASGAVSGVQYVGGLSGISSGAITNCYSSGNVIANLDFGGLLGTNSGTVTSSYWDIETSGQTTSTGGEGKTTTEMQSIDTYTGWDFTVLPVWEINTKNNLYPHFYWDKSFNFEGGSGTESDPYIISEPTHLDNVRYFLNSYFSQVTDIDLQWYENWEPIGYIKSMYEYRMFNGNYKGNGYSIKNLFIYKPETNYIGLFGYVAYGSISDLKVTQATVAGNEMCGILTGSSSGSIRNCSVSGIVNGTGSAGGLSGFSYKGLVDNCVSNCNVNSSTSFAGGLIGGIQGEIIINGCHSQGSITGLIGVGGLIGTASVFPEVINSYANCTVSGTDAVGGFIGVTQSETKITSCYSEGFVTGSGQNTGGFAGEVIDNCSINNCYSKAYVTGVQNAGGFIGYVQSLEINNCYSVGSVYSGTGNTGGFISELNSGTVTGSYWNTETSGQVASAGGVGKTTAEMQSIDTYAGWDFATTPIWAINEYLNDGYPYFNWDKRFHFAGGTGRPDNPFLIATPDHLNNVRNGMYANYRQTADIDLGVSPWKDGEGWNPIGYYNSDTDYGPFRGIYDGNAFNITNLTINRPLSHSTGLFGYIYQSTITNFNLQGVNVVGGIENTGALAGMVNNGNVFNSVSNGSVRGGNFTGGLIGYNTSGSTIENCSTYGFVSSAGEYTGGMLGYNYSESTINQCFTSAVVDGALYAGGFAGMNSWYSVISNSCSIGPVSGIDRVGGFIGNEGYGSKAERSFALGDVTSTGTNAGGFIGLTFDTSEVNDSYSRGNVSGDINVGGFIGYNHTSTLANCYSTGTVSAVTGPVGGFAALNFASSITASYWDIESSGVSVSAGGEGRSGDDMGFNYPNDSTYVGWDFENVWRKPSQSGVSGYPVLGWQPDSIEESDFSIPEKIVLYQNYPNPFNPETEIRFDLNKNCEVSLSVYNSNGQLVKELLKKNLSAGYHKVSFDASGLNSGLYFYRLSIDGKFEASRKMLMVK